MQLSIVGQARTAQLLADGGLEARVVDFSFFPFGPLFAAEQDRRSSASSSSPTPTTCGSADEDVMVAYLLEVTRSSSN